MLTKRSMGIARWPLDSMKLLNVGLALAVVYVVYRVARSMVGGDLRPDRMGYILLLFFVPFLLERPRYGLYLLCFTLLLVPFWVNDQYFRLLSTNTFLFYFRWRCWPEIWCTKGGPSFPHRSLFS